MASESIIVRGARVHNLKNVDVDIPHNSLTVVTGVSGSGKSSLAFDTIYAEGQRRYVESLSAYARQFLERIEKPDVDVIDGIAPAVAIRQKNSTRNPRSTVGTATEIFDYLRLLFARIGRTYCPLCGTEVKKDTVDEVAATILALDEGTRLNVLFPLQSDFSPKQTDDASVKSSRGRKKVAPAATALAAITDQIKERLFNLRQRGFNRLFQNGEVFEFSTPESLLNLDFSRPIFVLVDRIVVSSDVRARIVDAVESGYRESGEVIFEIAARASEIAGQSRFRFSQKFECKNDGTRFEEPEPRLFSFNNPYGACARCQGFGNTVDFDMNLVIPDHSKSLSEGAIEPWTKPKGKPYNAEMKRYAKQMGIPVDTPWGELTTEQQRLVIDGNGKYQGVRGYFNYLERKKYKLHVRVFLSRYRGYSLCPSCNGSRLRLEARQVRIGGRNICEICSMTVEQASEFFAGLKLTEQEAGIAEQLLQEISQRLRFLIDVGLEYLTMDRLSSTLSGGEAQRIQLATSLGSRLVGTLYVLDEPSIGLHSRDTHRLIKILHGLRDLGNTILVVEHDPDVMLASDGIIDLGPGAGEHGGRVIGVGTYDEIQHIPQSLTGRYLSHELRIQLPASRRKAGREKLEIRGARMHNLKGVDFTIPLRMLVAITGVSGSGKSTFVHDVLFPALSRAKRQAGEGPLLITAPGCSSIDGEEYIDDVVMVDQSPIGRTPRSNPVTYIKAFDGIRELFASLPEAKKRGFSAGHFSFNIPGGRCETCQGDGTVTVEMQFLADVELICEECQGTRYKSQVLDVRCHGKNIHDVLNLTVKEALSFFAGIPKLSEKLRVLDEVGLGYLRLGQSATTLSGGEAQRMKLAAHLQPAARSLARPVSDAERKTAKKLIRTLYIFDEPTTGLHFEDISKLLAAFRRLIEAGGSILVIEHNLEVIKTADWVIDMGPEGGERGGRIVGAGTPEAIAKLPHSYTGQFLAPILRRHAPLEKEASNIHSSSSRSDVEQTA
jgi:excinuclease ABC subunit A